MFHYAVDIMNVNAARNDSLFEKEEIDQEDQNISQGDKIRSEDGNMREMKDLLSVFHNTKEEKVNQ